MDRRVIAVVAATTAAQVAGAMGSAVFPVIAPKLAQSLSIDPSWIGFQMSLIYGSAMVGSVLFANLVPRYGGCRTTQIGLSFCVLGLLLGMQGSVAALVLTSVFIGIGMSINLPAAGHLLFRFSPPERRNFIFSFKQTGVPFAWALMAVIAPSITLQWGWRWALGLVLLSAVVTVIAMQSAREQWDDDRLHHTSPRGNLFEGLGLVWRIPSLRWLGIASFFLAFIQLCVGTFTVIMLVTEGDYSLVQAGLMLSVAQMAGVFGRLFWGWLADRVGDCAQVLQWLTSVMLVCCVVIGFLRPGWPVWLLAVLFSVIGATAVGWNGLYTAEVAKRSPSGKISIATGGAMVWNFAGILAGPTTFTLVYALTGSYAHTFGCLSVVVLAIFVALSASKRHAETTIRTHAVDHHG